jgi:hypothetical protein
LSYSALLGLALAGLVAWMAPVGAQGQGPGQPFAAPGFAGGPGQPGGQGRPAEGMRPGEAFVTRFSGTTGEGPQAVINASGVVGSIIDLRNPGTPPNGEHWLTEPQRAFVTAAEVGQVFGVALDNQTPPNVYLTATAAFGLHLQPGGGTWMEGMWGQGGGPGTVWRLEARNGYRPMPFATIGQAGRYNGGASLGNISFDRANRQFFVSDMESGLIHRLDLNGRDLGTFDHGTDGRRAFTDAESGQRGGLQPLAFDPRSQPSVADCPHGTYDQSPECWNIAASGRRIWGVGTRRDPATGESRLYYAVWSGPQFSNTEWAQLPEEEKRNSVWSVRLGPDGGFDPADVRRELTLPDFFVNPQDVARAGYSQPVSDITFSQCSERPVMLLAERGGMRNLGLGQDNAFATPGESRVLRYELDQRGTWRPVGRYDVGFYDRRNAGQPYIRANCAGGADFGPAHAPNGQQQPARRDQMVWMTGDNLCSPDGPCRLSPAEPQAASASTGAQGEGEPEVDPSFVSGVQGTPADLVAEVAPEAAMAPAYPQQGVATPETGPESSYMIDTDQNIDEQGSVIETELLRNDATRIGDIAIYQICEPPTQAPQRAMLLDAAPAMAIGGIAAAAPIMTWAGHFADRSHAQVASHGVSTSHLRFGSHSPYWSHSRWASHNTNWSHSRQGSHQTRYSHYRAGSHWTWGSQGHLPWISRGHLRGQSHDRARSSGHWSPTSLGHRLPWSPGHMGANSHQRVGSSGHLIALSHRRSGSRHDPVISRGHNPLVSRGHNPIASRGHNPAVSGGHNPVISRGGGHNPVVSRGGGHNPVVSRGHNPVISRGGGHNPVLSRGPDGGHNVIASRGGHSPIISRGGGHNPVLSRGPGGGHNIIASRGGHSPIISRGGGHNPVLSRGPGGGHNIIASRGGHSPFISRGGGGGHNVIASRGGHSPFISRGGGGGHNVIASRGGHNPNISRGPIGHRPNISRGPIGHRPNISRGPIGHSPAISRGRFGGPQRFQQQRFQPRFQQRSFQPRFQQRSFQPRFQQRSFQPRVQQRSFQPRVQQRSFQPRVQSRPSFQRRR